MINYTQSANFIKEEQYDIYYSKILNIIDKKLAFYLTFHQVTVTIHVCNKQMLQYMFAMNDCYNTHL